MDKKTIKQWAEISGKNPRSALFARERVDVGEKIGGYWFLNQEEWNMILKSMTGKGGRNGNGKR